MNFPLGVAHQLGPLALWPKESQHGLRNAFKAKKAFGFWNTFHASQPSGNVKIQLIGEKAYLPPPTHTHTEVSLLRADFVPQGEGFPRGWLNVKISFFPPLWLVLNGWKAQGGLGPNRWGDGPCGPSGDPHLGEVKHPPWCPGFFLVRKVCGMAKVRMQLLDCNCDLCIALLF